MSIIFLDFETTGLNIFHDDITEYCIIDKDTGYSMSSLVKLKNKRIVTPFITKKTGITTEMTNSGQTQEQAILNMVNFIDSHSLSTDKVTLIAHNGDSFDFPIFRRLMNKYKIRPRCTLQYFDTLRFAQILLPRNYKFNQPTLCKLFNIVNDAEHRATGDTKSLIKIYNHLTRLYSSKKSTIEDHISFTYNIIT